MYALVEPYSKLFDYAFLNAADPSLFSALPSAAEIGNLKAGDAVKIGLHETAGGAHPEHFWVEIVERRGVGGFVGRVVNNLQPAHGLKHGDHIVFCGHNIRQIEAAALTAVSTVPAKYPLHEEMQARAGERQGVQTAIDWIAEQGYEICEDRWKNKPTHDEEFAPIRLRTDKLVAAMLGIDYAAFMAEKDAMLEEIRNV